MTRNKPKSVYVTSKGLEETKSELEYLKKVKRKQITDRIQTAREFGDLTENSEYDAAVEEQTITEKELKSWRVF